MAKKKIDAGKEYRPASPEEIAGFSSATLKKWGQKVVSGPDIRDINLKVISTGSTKLDYILGRPFVEGSINEIYGENGTGKAQPLDAIIMTPSGPRMMGNILVGDKVLTPNGVANVTGVYLQGKLPIYRITFSDGSSTECCMNHIWHTKTLLDRAKGRPGSAKTVEEISKSLRRKDGAKNHMIPMTSPVQFEKKDLIINPYLLGVLLGDGYLPEKYSLMLSSFDDEILSRCNNILGEYACRLNHSSNYDYRVISIDKATSASLVFKHMLLDLNLLGRKSHDKFIPQEYMLSSIQDRLSILRGLMDTDGTIDKRGNITFTSTSLELAHDVRFIVQSLGGRATINSRVTNYTYLGEKRKGRISYRVNITMPGGVNPFLLGRKANMFQYHTAIPRRLIANIEYVGEKIAQCIKIDSSDELYLTDDFIVTHNTTMALEVSASATTLGKPVYYFDLERKLTEAQINMIPRLKRELFWRIRPDNGEEAVDMVEDCVRDVPGCVVIFDSITQMLPEVEEAESATKQTMGNIAKLCAKMVRKIVGPTERNRCMVLFISHITANLNPYASGDTTKGGKAVPDISSQRVRLKRLSAGLLKDKDTGDIYGQMTKCKVMKNNQSVPFREVEVPIIYGRGIDRTLDLLQICRDLGIVDYANGWYIIQTPEFPDGKRLREKDILHMIKNESTYRKTLIDSVKELLAPEDA